MRLTRRLAATVAAAGLMTVCASPAVAHDVVVDGAPHDGEELQTFPDSLTLEFSGVPREGFNTFAVSDAETGVVLFSGEPTIDDRMLSVELPDDLDPGAGDYQIGFQITSSDGHSTRGRTTFSVAGEPSADAAAGSSESEAVESDEGVEVGNLLSGPAGIVVAVAAILGVIAVMMLAIRRGKTSRELDEHLRDQHPDQDPEQI